jgi:hypothetical protein
MATISTRLALFQEIFECSRVMKWLSGGVAIFWGLQAFRDEFMSPELADRLRIVNLLPHWSIKTWIIVVLTSVLLTFLEGVLSWHARRLAPIIGPIGSFPSNITEASAAIAQCVYRFTEKNGMPPSPRAADGETLQHLWNWEKRLSAEFAFNCKEKVRVIANRLEAEKLMSIPVNDLLSRATIDVQLALEAATDLFRMSLWIRYDEAGELARRQEAGDKAQ